MTMRIALATLCFVQLLSWPAMASQPGGLAGKLIADLGDCDGNGLPPPQHSHTFEWYEAFDPRTLEPADIVSVTMALIPFPTGQTLLTFDDNNGANFAAISFSEGIVEGLHYDRSHWNDVTIELRPATQDFILAVNGARTGPIPYSDYCRDSGGCFTIQSITFFGFSTVDESAAWVDSLLISRQSPQGQDIFDTLTFDACEARPYAVGGALLFTTPPQRILRKGGVALARERR